MTKSFWHAYWLILSEICSAFSQNLTAGAPWTGITTLPAFSDLRPCAKSCISGVESSLGCEHIECFCSTDIQDRPLSSCIIAGCQDDLDVSSVTTLRRRFCAGTGTTTGTGIATTPSTTALISPTNTAPPVLPTNASPKFSPNASEVLWN